MTARAWSTSGRAAASASAASRAWASSGGTPCAMSTPDGPVDHGDPLQAPDPGRGGRGPGVAQLEPVEREALGVGEVGGEVDERPGPASRRRSPDRRRSRGVAGPSRSGTRSELMTSLARTPGRKWATRTSWPATTVVTSSPTEEGEAWRRSASRLAEPALEVGGGGELVQRVPEGDHLVHVVSARAARTP